jgi:propanol-preferring alcohol dehydrogenase
MSTMRAMVLDRPHTRLVLRERPIPRPAGGEILVEVAACGVCRTDLHVVDGELPNATLPIVPGHEIVGRVAAIGPGVNGLKLGERVGVPWLGSTCGTCPYCRSERENLCDHAVFTGYTRDGGLPRTSSPTRDSAFRCRRSSMPWKRRRCCAPASSAGAAIAWPGRGLRSASTASAQPPISWRRSPPGKAGAFTHSRGRGTPASQRFATSLGAVWAGSSEEPPPEPLDAAIIFAPVGTLVPLALSAVKKGGRVICGGIHMSDLPRIPYRLLWEERQIRSVANLTRADAREFLALAPQAGIKMKVTRYPLIEANAALNDLRAGRFDGAAVLVP